MSPNKFVKPSQGGGIRNLRSSGSQGALKNGNDDSDPYNMAS
jgi:hypothetical protein